ncbi:MAG: hypothetical protein ACYDCL_20840 [Myxococcales bacterium]
MGCAASPAPAPASTARAGPTVGVAESFLADFRALAAAGKLDALRPILMQAVGDGSAADLLAALGVVVQAGRAPDVSQGLSALLATDGAGGLAAVMAPDGPLHLVLSDPQLPDAADAAAAVSRTGALHAGVWPAALRLIDSPLVAASAANAADALDQGGAQAMSYLADALALGETAPSGQAELLFTGAGQLAVELDTEGVLQGLLAPPLQALADPALAQALPIAAAIADDLAQNPADLAAWNGVLDGLASLTPLLDASTVQALQQLDQAGLDGTLLLPDPDGSQRGLNLLDALAVIVGPAGSTLQAGLAAQRTVAASRMDELGPLLAPQLSYPYRNGQPVTDGSLGNAQKGFTQISQLIYDGAPAQTDTSSLTSLLNGIPGAYDLLSTVMGCGTIDPNDPVTSLPSYTESIAYQAFEDIVSQPDELTATERATFLACFLGRFNNLSGFLQNGLVSGALGLFGVDVSQILNPAVENILQNDLDGLYALAAAFDPDFDMSQSGSAVLGSHTRDGPLRLLYPLLNQLYLTPETDPVLRNGVRWFVALAGALDGQAYLDPQGGSWTAPPGQILEGVLPLGQALFDQPVPQGAAGAPLSALLWSVQALPFAGSTAGEVGAQVLAGALARHHDASAPPLLGPLLAAAGNHVDEIRAIAQALWLQGSFALDGSAGTPLPLFDRLLAGSARHAGLAALLGGPTPLAGSVQELQALSGTPLDRLLHALGEMLAADPGGQTVSLLSRALAKGAGGPLAHAGAAFLRIPGGLAFARSAISSGLLPVSADLLEPIDAEGYVPGLASLGDAVVQAGAAEEALALVQLSLSGASP